MGRRRKAHQHLPQRMYLRSGTYYLADASTGKWINLGRNYAEAMAQYGKLTDTTRKHVHTVGDMLDRYLLEVAPQKAASTLKGNLIQGKFLKLGLGHIPAKELTAELIFEYMDARPPVAANRELALLSHAYKKASRWGLGGFNPCRGLEKNKEKPRKRYVTTDEYCAFREFAGQPYAAFMDVAYLTALRKSDLLAIRLDQIQEDGIHVHVSKSDKDRVIVWTPTLRQAINNARKLRRGVRSMFLFSNRNGQPYTGSGLTAMWKRKMVKAVEQGVLAEPFTIHDLRAKAASDTDKQHAQSLLVHASENTTNLYRRKAEKITPLG